MLADMVDRYLIEIAVIAVIYGGVCFLAGLWLGGRRQRQNELPAQR